MKIVFITSGVEWVVGGIFFFFPNFDKYSFCTQTVGALIGYCLFWVCTVCHCHIKIIFLRCN